MDINFMNELKEYIIEKYEGYLNPLSMYTVEDIKIDIESLKSSNKDYSMIDTDLYCSYAGKIYNEYIR